MSTVQPQPISAHISAPAPAPTPKPTPPSASTPPPPTSPFSFDALFDNPVFAGGIGLAGLGAAATLGRRWTIQAAGLVKRRLLVNLEISKQDPSYPWILTWLTLRQRPKGFIASKLTRIHNLSMQTTSRISQNRPGQTKFLAQPGYGRHIVRHKNAYISIHREKQASANMTTGEPFETVTLTTLYAHQGIFEDIFKEAHQLEISAQEGKTIMWTARGSEWTPFGDPRKKRPLQSVILDKGIKERIVADVKDFLQRQEWYVDRGIPYRRGYLLYGPPGTGKSSFVQALAGELDFGVAIINLSERGMTDDKLAHLLTKLPPRTILLLEDADAAFSNRRQVDGEGFSGMSVTFSGLLNALDGVAAGEERIGFLTTNHIDRLDEALIRPGRVDMTVRIGEATRHQAGEMWDRFYGDIDQNRAGRQRFLQRLEEIGLVADAAGKAKTSKLNTSTAAIQGLFLFNKDNMDRAIEMAEGLIPRVYEPEKQEGIKMPA
ncbi:Mitochondrial chaperone BCS1 [Lachnellula cervina]|uniref:Mitochondrial chaperone BCS1 n=1 Tax=Lachnellula cervina TaxID=1316786 RepID=A0A7D8UT50_9HELO|nr:Mitochondrial chaperone BCS1 [Lachnellula cervina]